MLYEQVMKLYEKSKTDKCDIRVAFEKIAQETSYTDALKAAYAFGVDFYNDIVYFRSKNKLASLKTLAGIYEKEGKDAARQYVKELKDTGKY